MKSANLLFVLATVAYFTLDLVVASEVCYVCGRMGDKVSNPDAIIPIPVGYSAPIDKISCANLENAGLNTLIPVDVCLDLNESADFKDFCGCMSAVDEDSKDSTFTPFSFPVEGPKTHVPELKPPISERPTSMPIQGTNRPTIAPAIAPFTSNEPTVPIEEFPIDHDKSALPSSLDYLPVDLDDDGVEEDVVSLEPSESPSDIPSTSPSAVPSDVPSDVPSPQPSANRDISGVITEGSSSANTGQIPFRLTIVTLVGVYSLFLM